MSTMTAVSFLIEPAEAVAFGPPKSSVAGEAHHIRSQFPPSPRTVQGLIRTRLLLGAEPRPDLGNPAAAPAIAALVGPPEALPEGWQLRGPFPAALVPAPPEVATDPDEAGQVLSPWVPAPRFLLGRGKHGDATRSPPMFVRRITSVAHPMLSDLGESDDAPCLGRPDIGDAKPLDGWLNPTNLRFALEGEQVGGERRAWQTGGWARQRPCFVQLERQPGLAIDHLTGTAQADALFFTEALRFKPGSGLFCSLTGRLAPGLRAAALEQGAVSAGRKGRLACFRPAPSVHPDWLHVMDGRHLPEAVEGADERFWLLAITPAHLPDPRRPLARTSWPDGVEVVVEAALTGKLEAMGGFDITSGRPRPNRMYVPAGSAWLIRLRGGSPDSRAAVLRALHDRHPLGDPAEAAMGFGHTLVGRGPLTTEQVA